MRYPDEVIEEVRARSDIVDVISGYVRLQRKGNSHFGLCPFHNEKTPSFSVSSTKQMFYCFGCGAGGNVFTFLMKYDNLSFQEAVKVLADKYGVKLPAVDDSPKAKAERTKRETLLEINKEAATWYYRTLREKEGEKGRAYFASRGLSEEVMHRFGLGYAPVSSNALVKHLKEKGFADALIIEAGLAAHDEKKGVRDKFWNRVMFPIQDVNGKVIGFGGRVTGDAKPKYLNSPETPVFDKSRNLYGLNLAKHARKGYLILCEGYLDVIAVHEHFAPVAVASLGTAFTAGQASLLHRYTKEVILAYDSDTAGTTAALRAIGLLEEAGIQGKVMNLSPHKDPDEFLRAEGADAFAKRIADAQSPFFFEVEAAKRNYNMNDPGEKTAFYREVAAKLCTFETAIERDNYLNAFAAQYGVPARDMKELVTEHAAKTGLVSEETRRGSPGERRSEKDVNLKPQRLLLTWLSEEPEIFRAVKKYVSAEDFTDALYRELAKKVFAALEEGNAEAAQPGRLLSDYEDEEAQQRAAEVFHTRMPHLADEKAKEKALRDVVYDVKRIALEQKSETFDAGSVQRNIEGKRILEELRRASGITIA